MILQFQIERKNKIENSSRTAWGGIFSSHFIYVLKIANIIPYYFLPNHEKIN